MMLLLNLNYFSCANSFLQYKIIRVIDADTFYVDFNKDGYAQKNEKVRIKHADGFEVTVNKPLDFKSKSLGLTKHQSLALGYMGKKFAEQHLLNKTVKVVIDPNYPTDRYNRNLVTIIYTGSKNYEEELLKAGLAIVYKKADDAYKYSKYENTAKIKANAINSKNLNLVILNKKMVSFTSYGVLKFQK